MTWLILVAALSAVDPASGPSFDSFFAEFAKKRDGIHTLEARFSQENVSPDETVRSRGAIVYVKPRRILFRYEEPDAGTTYVIDEHRAYEYEPDIKQVQIYALEDNPQTEVFFLGFDDNTEALRKGYDVVLFEPGAKERGAVKDKLAPYAIRLKPKPAAEKPAGGADEKEKQTFREVQLFLRESDYLPIWIHIVNDDDSQVYIAVADFKINEKFDPALAQMTLPEGTKIIENDELLRVVGAGGESIPGKPPAPEKPLVQSSELGAPPK